MLKKWLEDNILNYTWKIATLLKNLIICPLFLCPFSKFSKLLRVVLYCHLLFLMIVMIMLMMMIMMRTVIYENVSSSFPYT